MLPTEQRRGNEQESGRGAGEGEGEAEGGERPVEKKKGRKTKQESSDQAELPWRDVEHEDLSPVTRQTRLALREAIVGCYASRVWDPQSVGCPFFDDAQVFLTPSHSSSKFLNAFKLREEDRRALCAESPVHVPTESHEVKRRETNAWAEIEARAVQAATAEAERNAKKSPPPAGGALAPSPRSSSSSGRAPGASSAKRRKLDEDDEELAGMFDDEEGEGRGAGAAAAAVADLVEAEMKRFRRLKMDPRDLLVQEGLDYWAKNGRHAFSVLRHVARQVFGVQASAAHVERDLSGASQLLSGRRSRLDAHWVEMLLFLHTNFDRIPAFIPEVPRAKALDCFPKRFQGLDEALAAAENLLDPLETDWGAFVEPNFGLPVDEQDKA